MKANRLNSVLVKRPETNYFDKSHQVTQTQNMGQLVPCYLEEVLPGDKVTINTSHFMRTLPLLAPMMQEVFVYTHYFFVPNRLMWRDWKEFITGGDLGLDAPALPYVLLDQVKKCTIPDYLGLPIGTYPTNPLQVSAFPFYAYALCRDRFYRNQQLQPVLVEDTPLSPGDNTAFIDGLGLFGQPLRRNWAADYFTTCLPSPQKGAAVEIPLGATADLIFDPSTDTDFFKPDGSDSALGAVTAGINPGPGGVGPYDSGGNAIRIDVSKNHKVNLATAIAASVNSLRWAFKLQQYLEINNVAGSRYIEWLKAHFDVTSSDSRLQNPEYLGGGKTRLQISEVLQTSQVEAQPTPLGDMAGRAVSSGSINQVSRYFEEHGWIIGISSVMPTASYSQGIPKHWLREDALDYPLPMFGHLGEQPVQNREVYAGAAAPKDTFGYQSIYADCTFTNNRIAGEITDTLAYWTMAQQYASEPALNAEFIQCNPTHRVFANIDPMEQKLIVIFDHQASWRRALPLYGNPSFG